MPRYKQLHNAGLITQQRKVFEAREKFQLPEFQGQPLIMQTPRDISCKAHLYSQQWQLHSRRRYEPRHALTTT